MPNNTVPERLQTHSLLPLITAALLKHAAPATLCLDTV